MHEPLHLLSAEQLKTRVADPWIWTIERLETVCQELNGNRLDGWIRRGQSVSVIAARHLGAKAGGLDRELAILTELTRKIRNTAFPKTNAEAVAFFHLRFQMIHPLRDGNGRIGRFIMATQVEDVFGLTRSEFIKSLHAHENDYRMVFVSDDRRTRFELMVDLVARLVGVPPPEGELPLPYPIDPLHCDDREARANIAKKSQKLCRTEPHFWKRF